MKAHLVLLAALALPAAAEEPAGTGCGRCDGHGRAPCDHAWDSLKSPEDPNVPKPHELDVGALKVGTFECSECLQLVCCGGRGWSPCKACAPEAVRQSWTRQGEAARTCLDGVSGLVGHHKPIRIRTAHYYLFTDLCLGDFIPHRVIVYTDPKTRTYRDGFWFDEIEELQLQKRRSKPGPHLLAHLYARRLEECWEQCSATLDPDGTHPVFPELAPGCPLREFVSLLRDRESHPKSFPGYPGGPGTARAPANGSGLSCAIGKATSGEIFARDEEFHGYMYHYAAEMLIHDYVINEKEYKTAFLAPRKGVANNQQRIRYPEQDLPAWIHEGFARMQEIRRFDQSRVHCCKEVKTTDFTPRYRRKYLQELKSLLGSGKLVPFAELARMHCDQFPGKVHNEIWHLMDFIRRRDPSVLGRLVSRTKVLSCEIDDAHEAFARTLKELYGLTPLALEEAWRQDLAETKP